ncbi:hypothetical protein JCM3765_003908 [Sporobolomyces pararoseus]
MSSSCSTSSPSTVSSKHKHSLISLPISPLAPIYHLPPDPLFPTPDSLFQLSSYEPPEDLAENGPVALKVGDPVPPSMLRRSRQVRMGGTFTYTSPLPLQFPYDLEEPGAEPTGPRKASDIERQLRKFEIDPSKPVFDASLPSPADTNIATAYTCDKREASTFPQAKLLSISQKLLDEWIPNLDIGNEDGTEQEQKVRQQFIDVVAGKTVLSVKGKEGEKEEGEGNGITGFAPWAQAYAGHQFGSFAGQLGDGRAISIACTPPTEEVAAKTGFRTIELQLKGAGRTPYSRFADGLAVLRSSVREYLGAEALAALRIPTSRALALVHLPTLHVLRERVENAAIVTRVSGSWLRIGSFELPSYRTEWETLRKLSSYTGRQVFGFEDSQARENEHRSMALSVVREVSRRTAIMIAGWQAYGFCHGVMNTDNFALNGATIDFGPYAFMDVFDSGHICNHSDDMGRYAFNKQPTMGVFAIDKLGDALAPLIGKEVELVKTAEGTGFVEAQQGWTGDEDSEEVNLEEWSKIGKEQISQVKEEFIDHFKKEYSRLMRLKLGLTTDDGGDFQLFSTLLDLMERNELDFTNSFRLLSQFTSVESPSFSAFLDALLNSDSTSPSNSSISNNDRSDWTNFFKSYEARLLTEGTEAASTRVSRMNSYNPRFALRQWVLEETIKKLGNDGEAAGVEQLNRVLEMAQNPFEAYGESEIGRSEGESVDACPTKEEIERRRLAGVGSKDMLGFQCSCSS